MEDLLREILYELKAVNAGIERISNSLPHVQPLYNLDDVHAKLDEVAEQITGPLGYNLGDLHEKLIGIEANTD